MNFTRPDISNFPVMLSASLPQDLVGTTRAQELYDIIGTVVGGVLAANGSLIFGGHPSVTPLVHRVARSFDFRSPRIKLFQLRQFQEDAPQEVFDKDIFGEVFWVGTGSRSDDASLERDLAEMREAMVRASRAGIFVGGRTASYRGGMPGIRDEYRRFVAHHPEGPVYLLGMLGGEALRIIKSLDEEANREPNHLAEEELSSLHYSTDIGFAASLILADIRRYAAYETPSGNLRSNPKRSGDTMEVTTGDTIYDENRPVIPETMEFPSPLIRVAVEPRTRADQDKLGTALSSLAQEDPSFDVSTDMETGQTFIAGTGELHLESIIDRMRHEFDVEANVGKPQVVYLETITQPAKGMGRYKRQTGGRGQYGHVELEVEPAQGEGFVFENNITSGIILKEFIKPTEEGVRDALARGFLAGYEMVDVRVKLVFGSYHEVDSDERSFHIAGSLAFQDAVKKANPVLLEPIMRVEVVTPEDYMGAVKGDLNRRRGQIEKMEPRPGGVQVVTAYVPLSEMFGYTTDLRSMTQGRATSTMHFERYTPLPHHIADQITSKSQEQAK